MSLTLTPPLVTTFPEDETFTIPGLSWEQYVAINDALGDRAGLRTLYLDGSLTFLSPAYIHEWAEDALDKILLAVAVGCDIEMSVVGSTTLRKGDGVAGLEGDRAYYLRENVAQVGRPETLDLTIHPPPDLAIEVENTSKATDSMPIYARIGVPEVWRHDVRRGSLTFWALQPNGTYQSVPRSSGFPFLTPADVLFQLKRADELRNLTRWFAQLTNWVRTEIQPRIAGEHA